MATQCLFLPSKLGRCSSRAILTAMIGVLVNLSATAAPWGPWSPPNDWLQNCLIYTFDAIETMDGRTEIYADETQTKPYRSDVCSLGVLRIGGNGQQTSIPSGAPKVKDSALVAPTINLVPLYQVSECVYDNTGSLSGTCPNVQQVDLSGMPSKVDVLNGVGLNQWTQFPTITPGPQDIQCANSQKLTLAPGQYNRLIMGRWCELTLKAGIYQFRSVETQTQDTPARIILATKDPVPPDEDPQVVEFWVKEYMRLGHYSEVNKLQRRLLRIYIEGTDAASPPLWGGQSGPWTTFNFRGDGHFNACWVYSPNGTQSWRGHPKNIAGFNNSFYTQIFAQNVRHSMTDTLRIAFTHPQDPACYGGEEITCGSIGRAFLPGKPGMICDPTTGQVKVNGWDLDKKTMTELQFWDANLDIPVTGDVPTMRAKSCLEVGTADLIYDPSNDINIRNTMTTNVSGGVVQALRTNCIPAGKESVQLYPVLLGPILSPPIAPVCFSVYTAERLVIDKTKPCSVVPVAGP